MSVNMYEFVGGPLDGENEVYGYQNTELLVPGGKYVMYTDNKFYWTPDEQGAQT